MILDLDHAAMRRVKDKLPKPDFCDNCCEFTVSIKTHNEVHGRTYHRWPYLYYCDSCGAYVGIHHGTDIPQGTMADEELRRWRKKAKVPFEKWRKNKGIGRSKAYSILADKLKIPVNEFHFGWFDLEMCKEVFEVTIKL